MGLFRPVAGQLLHTFFHRSVKLLILDFMTKTLYAFSSLFMHEIWSLTLREEGKPSDFENSFYRIKKR